MLDGKSVFHGVEIFSIALQGSGSNSDVCRGGQERSYGVREIRDVSGREREPHVVTLERGIPIVVLARTVVNAEACSNYSFVIDPISKPKPGIEVGVDGKFKRRSRRTNPLTPVQVEYAGPIEHFRNRRIEIPAQAHVYCEIRPDFPFVLKIRHDEGVAESARPPGGLQRERIKLIVENAVIIGKADGVIVRDALVEPDAPHFTAELEGVAAADDGCVIDVAPGGADFVIRVVVVQAFEIRKAHGGRKHAHLRIVKWGPVHTEFEFIEHSRREHVLERKNVVLRFVNGLLLIEEVSQGRSRECAVDRHAEVEKRAIGKPVIDAQQAAILAQVDAALVRVFGREIIHRQLANRVSIQDRRELRRRLQNLLSEGRAWHEGVQGLPSELAESFLGEKEEGFIFLDWTADGPAVLIEAKGGNASFRGSSRIEIQIEKGTGIEDAVA